jgi:uncharacterized protein with GYD domain
MGTYVSLIGWTEQGIKNFRDTVSRAEAARAAAAKMGGNLRDIYWTVGQHDIVVVSDFPDDETAMTFLLQLGSLGNVRTSTMRAFSAEEMAGIVARAG